MVGCLLAEEQAKDGWDSCSESQADGTVSSSVSSRCSKHSTKQEHKNYENINVKTGNRRTVKKDNIAVRLYDSEETAT